MGYFGPVESLLRRDDLIAYSPHLIGYQSVSLRISVTMSTDNDSRLASLPSYRRHLHQPDP